jgi:hypothetical protein
VTRIEEDFTVLDHAHPPARGAAHVFAEALGTARARRRRARLLTAGAAVAAMTLVGGVALAQSSPDEPTTVQAGPGDDEDAREVEPAPTTTAAPQPTVPPTTAPDELGPTTTAPAAHLFDDEVVDIRVESHGGADQVIFELAEDAEDVLATAGVQQLDELPLDCAPASVSGDSYLMVRLGSATEREQRDIPMSLLGPVAFEGTDLVTEVATGCLFDGELLAVIGLSSPQMAFRTDTLTGPPRLLVEVYPA